MMVHDESIESVLKETEYCGLEGRTGLGGMIGHRSQIDVVLEATNFQTKKRKDREKKQVGR